jgi:hypothetical protein
MKLPPRNTCASVHQRLKNVAERSGERFNDLLQHYALERFLCRLAASPHRSRFVLKGALMLRVWEVATIRPTRDIDLLGRTANDPQGIAAAARDICATAVDPDGLEFDGASVEVGRIAEEAEYKGASFAFCAGISAGGPGRAVTACLGVFTAGSPGRPRRSTGGARASGKAAGRCSATTSAAAPAARSSW